MTNEKTTDSAASALSAGLGVVLPPLTITKPLTVVMYPDGSKAEVDAAIAAIKRGDTYFRNGVSEMFFHNLRLHIALDPALEKMVSVLYATNEGCKQIGLRYEDELYWPVGFCDEAWVTESAIQAARNKTPNDRVEGRDAALSRRVPSHDGLCP